MKRPTIELLSSALLVTLACIGGACDQPSEAAELERSAPFQAADAQAADAQVEHAQIDDAQVANTPLASSIDASPVLASAANMPMPATSTKPSTLDLDPSPRISDAQPEPLAPRSHSADSLRHASLLPAGTPAEHVAAFTNLPLAKRDKAPIAGVGASGIHLDELELGIGWASSRCEDPTTHFELGAAERVNLCFRVVHPRDAERVSVEWARDGKVRQIIQIGIKDSHTYRTRAWLPVTEGRAGAWTATVKSEDGSVLGQTQFEIGA